MRTRRTSHRRTKKVLALLSLAGLVFWFSAAVTPLPALAAASACQCKDNTTNKQLLCYCGSGQCTQSCTAGHSCSCESDAKKSQTCVDLDPCGTKSEVSSKPPDLTIQLLPDFALTNSVFTTKGTDDLPIREISIPWIAQYVQGLYKYAVAIAGVISAAMLMLGGLLYLSSGGNSERVSKGKEIITNALLGLLLVIGTYVVLNTINPDLVNLQPLTVSYIQPIKFGITDFSDEALESSPPARDPDLAPQVPPSSAPGQPAAPSQPPLQTGDMEIINVAKAYETEKPVGIKGKNAVYRKGTKRAWEMLKKAAALVDKKDCAVVVAAGWGRSGMDQLNGVINRNGKWSAKCKVYYGCTVSMGWRWCVLESDESKACAVTNLSKRCWWTAPRTPDLVHNKMGGEMFCDVTSLLHTDATDAWAIEKSQATDNDGKNKKYICGTDNAKCAKHRCQRELIRAWTSLGGCMLDNNAKVKDKPIRWESWHLEPVPNGSCHTDADARFANNGFPFPGQ